MKPEELRLLCRSCNTEWDEERPEGYHVRYEKGNNYLVNKRDPEKKKYFRCPECKSQKKIGRLSPKPVAKKLVVRKPRLNKEIKSLCCGADVRIGGEGETHYYVCKKCNNTCGIRR